jgi:hypothetical protein
MEVKKRMLNSIEEEHGFKEYLFTGIIVVILLLVAGWILKQAFFGSGIVKTIFWVVVSISAIIGALYGVGRLVFWLKEEFD